MATSEASESYITLTNFKKGIKRDASAYPIFKNERYYNTFIRHFKATAKAQGLSSLMDPNFTPGSHEYVNPNRDSPNGYPTVTPAELQPVTLAH